MGVSAPAELKTKIISLNLSPSSGNINTFLNSAEGQVAGRGGDKHSPSSGQAGSEVAEKGMAEFRQGLANIKGGKKKDPDASTPSSTAPETKTGAPENQPSTVPSAGPPVAATADAAPKEGSPTGPVQQEPPETEAPTAAPVTDRVSTGDQQPMDQQSPVQSQPGSEGHAAPKETDIEPKTTDKPPTPESRISGEQSPMQKQPADMGDKTASGVPAVTSGSHP